MNKYSNEDILLILQRAFAKEIRDYNWQCEFVEDTDLGIDRDESFFEVGNYSIYKTTEGFHLTGWETTGGDYWSPPDVSEYDISDEKDIWDIIREILQCELEIRLDNTLPDIAEELEYKNNESI